MNFSQFARRIFSRINTQTRKPFYYRELGGGLLEGVLEGVLEGLSDICQLLV